MRTAFMVNLVFNAALSFSENGMYYMFLLIRNLQLILNLPFLKVVFPANVMTIL